ncbi:MAG: transposase [Gammaproteobacteria bacterium]|nr:transposase [Gammaproteobacteria bacterium]
MLRAHRIELKGNNKQNTYFAKAAGVARQAYNWALDEWQKEYVAGEKPTETALRRKLNSIKREKFPWMLEVTKNAPQMAIIQLGQAFKNFFAKRSRYPQFRKKWQDDRFTLTNDQFSVNNSRIRIPNLGWVRMRESLRFVGKILSATISRSADKWFVSITVDTPYVSSQPAHENQVAVGVDVGVSHFATLSTGEKETGPKPHKALLPRLKRLSRSLSRKQKSSKNRNKARLKVARLHRRISNIRKDAIHQFTTKLVKTYDIIGIEDLNVKGMIKNRKLSRSISDMGFFEFRRQLGYKAAMNNKKIVVADRWFPSSKMCCACNYKLNKLSLAEREWICPACRKQHDRDINSAINLEKQAVSSTVSACGASSNGIVVNTTICYGVMKQEFNTESA